ncbi:PhaM family polyhydroxyalkanoate granule multifunctional regulatory protein [Hydrogenophaga sp.]|uniref:PhaM family polyhydroxyalkanoate granule multifunctional regulatory protein n=1 Tax=Hydrogenophaga sp. TaxID=1904254 RepID=UPI00351DCD84
MSDASGSGFGKFVPGFEFLQNLAGQAAGGVAQGLGQSIPQLPNLGNWVAPTFSVEDLEKRIEELKAVHFWLDQNSKALAATIQALEVQKMTLATLQNMNFSMGDVANALKVKAAETFAGFAGSSHPPAPAPTQFAGLEIPPRTYGTPAPVQPEADAGDEADDEAYEDEPNDEPEDEPAPPTSKPSLRKSGASAPAEAPAGGVVDPMQWWGALSQQFQHIAANAMKDVAKQTALDTTREVASGLTEQAVKTATGMAGKVTRGLTDTVARNVGMATGVGKAAARAVAPGKATPKPTAKPAARAAAKSPAKKAPVRKPAAAPQARAAAQPMAPGDWTMPNAFFQVPGFSLGGAAAPKKARPTKKAATSPTRKPAAKKATAKKSAPPSGRR